jgi:hypothetical protein
MLPVVAAMVMGGLSKKSAVTSEGNLAEPGDLLFGLLDQNRDAPMADDVLGMLRRFFAGR